jgi:hypothetical protein
MSQIKKIGVVGAGNMGSGIVQKIAQEGIPVVMVDLKDEFVQRGLGTIRRLLQEGVERKIFKPEQVDQILSRVTGTTRQSDRHHGHRGPEGGRHRDRGRLRGQAGQDGSLQKTRPDLLSPDHLGHEHLELLRTRFR